MVRRFHDEALAAGHLVSMRSEQNPQWMWQLTDQLLRQQITDHNLDDAFTSHRG